MRWIKTVLAAGIVTSLIGCSGEESAIRVAPVPEVSAHINTDLVWRKNVTRGVQSYYTLLAPAVVDGVIYSASREGKIVAVSQFDGKQVWKTYIEEENDEPALLAGGLTVANRQLFIGSENGKVMSFDSDTGEPLWTVDVPGSVLSTPLAAEGMLIIHTNTGVLQAMSMDSGETLWQIKNDVPPLMLRGDSSPVGVYGGVFWGTANGRIQAASLQTGMLAWQKVVGRATGDTEIDRIVDVDASPIIVGDRLWIIGYNGNLLAIDLRSGNIVLRRAYSSSKNMAVGGNHLYIVDDKDHLIAVDLRSGNEVWQNQELEYRELTPPAVIRGYVVVCDMDGYLYWLDPKTGMFASKEKVNESGLNVAPVALDDGYLLQTRGGTLIKSKIVE